MRPARAGHAHTGAAHAAQTAVLPGRICVHTAQERMCSGCYCIKCLQGERDDAAGRATGVPDRSRRAAARGKTRACSAAGAGGQAQRRPAQRTARRTATTARPRRQRARPSPRLARATMGSATGARAHRRRRDRRPPAAPRRLSPARQRKTPGTRAPCCRAGLQRSCPARRRAQGAARTRMPTMARRCQTLPAVDPAARRAWRQRGSWRRAPRPAKRLRS